jgi:hypothetical protein
MMAMPLANQIRRKAFAYLSGRQSLRSFHKWFVAATCDIPHVDESTQELVDEIDLLMAEYTSGHWTREDLNERLGALIENVSAGNRYGRWSEAGHLNAGYSLRSGATYQMIWSSPPAAHRQPHIRCSLARGRLSPSLRLEIGQSNTVLIS